MLYQLSYASLYFILNELVTIRDGLIFGYGDFQGDCGFISLTRFHAAHGAF